MSQHEFYFLDLIQCWVDMSRSNQIQSLSSLMQLIFLLLLFQCLAAAATIFCFEKSSLSLSHIFFILFIVGGRYPELLLVSLSFRDTNRRENCLLRAWIMCMRGKQTSKQPCWRFSWAKHIRASELSCSARKTQQNWRINISTFSKNGQSDAKSKANVHLSRVGSFRIKCNILFAVEHSHHRMNSQLSTTCKRDMHLVSIQIDEINRTWHFPSSSIGMKKLTRFYSIFVTFSIDPISLESRSIVIDAASLAADASVRGCVSILIEMGLGISQHLNFFRAQPKFTWSCESDFRWFLKVFRCFISFIMAQLRSPTRQPGTFDKQKNVQNW